MNTANKIFSVIAALLLVLSFSRLAFAVAANVNLEVVDQNGNPVKVQVLLLTPKAGGETITANNDDDDNVLVILLPSDDSQYIVEFTDEEGKKRRGGLFVPLGAGPHNLQVTVGSVSWWQGLSETQKFLTVVLPSGAIAAILIAVGDDDNDGDAAQNTGGGAPTTPPPGNDPGGDQGQGDQDQTQDQAQDNVPVSGNFNVVCVALVNPQNSAGFVNAEILPVWSVEINPATNTATIRLANGVVLTGTVTNVSRGNISGQANLSGSGVITGVGTTATFQGTIDFINGNLSGVLQAGPPLGGGPNDQVQEQCDGTLIAGP